MTDTERVKRIVEKDSIGALNDIMSVVQSDIADVLGEFMNVTGMNVSLDSYGHGGYTVKIDANVDRFYDIGKISSDIV